MRLLFALPGLHRYGRGAEVVFEQVAQAIAEAGRHQVTLAGMGQPRPDRAYDFVHVDGVGRERFERWPRVPLLRHEFMWEELTFATALSVSGAIGRSDLTMTTGYPYTNWALRRPRLGKRPAHVFVTQNGDWPAFHRGGETRLFGCDGLICTNPIYFDRNRERWPATLIPNGVDPARFHPGEDRRAALGLPTDRPVVLMVSALEPGKRVLEAMRAMAHVPDAALVVAGDGALRDEVDRLAGKLLPGRFQRLTVPHATMPDLYRSADLFLHTKIEESFGNVYVEALSSGLPIVAHDDAVSRWILGEHATLVDSTSTEALAAAIRSRLAGPRRQDGAAVAWAHERYAWPTVAARYAAFFEEVAARR